MTSFAPRGQLVIGVVVGGSPAGFRSTRVVGVSRTVDAEADVMCFLPQRLCSVAMILA